MQKKYQNNPIFTIVSIVTSNTTIASLHFIIFRKLFFKTNLKEEYEEHYQSKGFLEKLWNSISKKNKSKKFFYLKINDKKFAHDD